VARKDPLCRTFENTAQKNRAAITAVEHSLQQRRSFLCFVKTNAVNTVVKAAPVQSNETTAGGWRSNHGHRVTVGAG